MVKQLASISICIAFSVSTGIAQTNVTTNGGSSGSIPMFTSGENIENSVITQSGGKVGIGTTSPSELLTTGGAIRILPLFPQGSGNGLYLYSDGTNGFVASYGPNTTTAGNVWLSSFRSDGSGGYNMAQFSNSQATINTPLNVTGNLGIGTTTPSEPLEVNGNTKVDGTLAVTGTGGVNVESGGVTFPDGTVQTTAYPASSSGGSAPIQVVNNPTESENEAQINGGVSPNGTGIKHVRTSASCSATPNTPCQILVTWPGSAFADMNYTAVCNAKSISYSAPPGSTGISWDIEIPDSGKTTTTMTLTVRDTSTNTQVTVQGLNCIAIHD